MTATTPQDQHTVTRMQLAGVIDHTKLTFGPEEDQAGAIDTLCREAAENGFYAVCVRPEHVVPAKQRLADTGVAVATVIEHGRAAHEQQLTEDDVMALAVPDAQA